MLKLHIERFKSIRDITLDCKKTNVFIGKPNSGKSNILESIGILSIMYYGGNLKEWIRYDHSPSLFFNGSVDEGIKLTVDSKEVTEVKLRKDNTFGGAIADRPIFSINWNGDFTLQNRVGQYSIYKYYKFSEMPQYSNEPSTILIPPNGRNLLNVILHNKGLKEVVRSIIEPFGFKLMYDPVEQKIRMRRVIDDTEVVFPYEMLSDTLKRLVFTMSAIETSSDSVLTLEEPEAHLFPYYTKYLAEVIALDNRNNQFFIATHNPHFLSSLIEKSKKGALSVITTYWKDCETKVYQLSDEEIEQTWEKGTDFFFNVESFEK